MNIKEEIRKIEAATTKEIINDLTHGGGYVYRTAYLNKMISEIEKMLDKNETAFDIKLNDERSAYFHNKAFKHVHEFRSFAKGVEYAHKIAETFIAFGNV